MTVSTDVVIGIDIGTTSSKALATSRCGTRYVEQPTPWHTASCGQTEIDPYRLVDAAVELLSLIHI